MTTVQVQKAVKLNHAEVTRIVRWTLRFMDIDNDPELTVSINSAAKPPYRGLYYRDEAKIVARVPSNGDFPAVPFMYGRKNSPPIHRVLDWREAVVGVIAHEGEHHRQSLAGKRFSEIETEWREWRLTLLWRQHVETPVRDVLDETTEAQVLRCLGYRPASVEDLVRGMHITASVVEEAIALNPRLVVIDGGMAELTSLGRKLLPYDVHYKAVER